MRAILVELAEERTCSDAISLQGKSVPLQPSPTVATRVASRSRIHLYLQLAQDRRLLTNLN
jgi:hypothetical protein